MTGGRNQETVKIGFKTTQVNVEWGTLRATWELGDTLPVFDSAWIFDHFVHPRADGGCHEAWTTLGALAARTRRLQVGHLVLGNTHRHPALTAKMGATMDHITGGRFVLGIGAGWNEREHEMFGWDLPPIGRRMDMLAASIRIIRGMWASPDGFTVEEAGYHVEAARCDPPPFTVGGPPVWVGTKGRIRGLRIVAELAAGWNFSGDLAEFAEARDALLRHCEAVGRDPSTVEVSAQVQLRTRPTGEVLEEALQYVRAGADHIVLGMPAQLGPAGLQRLAAEVAEPLRGATT